MKKNYPILITALFCLFLFGFGAALFLLPDRSFSEQENRYLSQFKAPTLQTVKSGKFMESFEDYVTDQFPLRDRWINLKAWAERLAGKEENNAVYLGTDGQTLFAQFTAPSGEELSQRVGYVNQIAEKLTVPVYFSLIPDKSYVWADLLPDGAPLADDGSMLSAAGALCSDKVTWIDLKDALAGEDSFYRTDHHWSTFGAYRGYLALARALGLESAELDAQPVLRSDSFYGTTWSSSGAAWVRPDSIHTIVPEGGFTGATAVTRYPEGSPIPGSLYDLSKLEVKDKYSMFLGGNQPLCVIENPDAAGGKLLVIRDSYSDSLAPLLSTQYREVHLFDPRYNLTSISSYVEEHGIDQVLVLYSAANFASDTHLFQLPR